MTGTYTNPRFKYIKNILDSAGHTYILSCDYIENPNAIKQSITHTLKDQYLQVWNNALSQSSKGKTYQIGKENISLETYHSNHSRTKYIPLIKFRTSNHKLPIELGRWNGIDIAERKCIKCNMNTIGDEFHYLLECPSLEIDRKRLIKPYYFRRPNIIKFKE